MPEAGQGERQTDRVTGGFYARGRELFLAGEIKLPCSYRRAEPPVMNLYTEGIEEPVLWVTLEAWEDAKAGRAPIVWEGIDITKQLLDTEERAL